MTPSELSAIRARLDAATPGPWEAVTPKRYAAVRSEKAGCYVYTQGKIPADTHADTVTRQQRDAHLIANAPTDLRALLDEVERLTADPLPAAAWVREVERAAFARGAEAMRTALLQRVSWGSDLADRIRNEPVPEDK